MEMWKTAALPMENPFTAHGKGQALSHSLQTGFPQRRYMPVYTHSHNACCCEYPSYPILSYPIERDKRK